jgi:hypothetical protein
MIDRIDKGYRKFPSVILKALLHIDMHVYSTSDLNDERFHKRYLNIVE